MRRLRFPDAVGMKHGTPIMFLVCMAVIPATASIVVTPPVVAWRAGVGRVRRGD